MKLAELCEDFELCPIAAAVREDGFSAALSSPVRVIILLEASVMTVADRIRSAHEAGKRVLVHLDLASGIGRDSGGIGFLSSLGADGIISTRGDLIKCAKDEGVFAIQRYFAVDSHGISSIEKMFAGAKPDCIEILPGVIEKVIRRFSGAKVPVIASGLIETKQEVTAALSAGAVAVTTSREALWSI